jgi:hypothetical protein
VRRRGAVIGGIRCVYSGRKHQCYDCHASNTLSTEVSPRYHLFPRGVLMELD